MSKSEAPTQPSTSSADAVRIAAGEHDAIAANPPRLTAVDASDRLQPIVVALAALVRARSRNAAAGQRPVADRRAA